MTLFDHILAVDDGSAHARDVLRLARDLGGPEARVEVLGNCSPRRLAAAANARRVDLIVTSAARCGRLLEHARVPVALAPAGHADAPPGRLRILSVGYDGEPESQAALQLAEQVALAHAATMRVYAAATYGDAHLADKLHQEIEHIDSRVRAAATTVHGDPVRVLADAAQQGTDLLVVGSHARGPLGRALMGSISCELAARAPCPLLVVPPGLVPVKEGRVVAIRPVEPTDTERVLDEFDHLGEESRRLRFMGVVKRLSQHELEYLTDLDHHGHEALMATAPDGSQALGIARYIRDPVDPAQAEVAIEVIDEWQGRGLGSALLERLVARARDEGIDTFTALCQSENQGILRLLAHAGPCIVRFSGPGTVDVTVRLRGDEAGRQAAA